MAAVCQFLNSKNGGECVYGVMCPFRHIRGDRTIVCKHWLRGLCKKGDQCEFLHEFDMKKMPECYFYSRFNACHNKECPFLHIDPESKIKDCPWYDRGFCRHGPHCRHRHVRRVLCMNYLSGFCPNGWDCKHMHPRFELPPSAEASKDQSFAKKMPICHFCGEAGHKASNCKKNTENFQELNKNISRHPPHQNQNSHHSSPSPSPAPSNETISPSSSGFPPGPRGNSNHSHRPHNQKNAPYPCSNPPNPSGFNRRRKNSENPGNGPNTERMENNGGSGDGSGNTPVTSNIGLGKGSKPLGEITCYKCGNKGHYANKCPKGHLAFLSNQRSHK